MAGVDVNEVPTGSGGGRPPGGVYQIGGQWYNANGDPIDASGNVIGGGSSRAVTQVLVDPQSGRRYTADANGVFVAWMDPAPSGGSTTVRVAPADSTGAFQIYTSADGSVWRINKVTGDTEMISGPLGVNKLGGQGVDPRDLNGDGLDDSTGMAVGVYRDSNSPSGYSYPGASGTPQAVLPNGALYTGAGTYAGADAKTWTGQGPQGYGTYYLDGPNATPGTYIGDTRAPSAAGGSGVSGSGARVSTGGSSGEATAMINAAAKAASDANAAAMQAAQLAWQGKENEAQRAWQAAQNAANRALQLTTSRAQFELTRSGMLQDQTKMQLDAANQFSQIISSTDPIRYRAWLAAGGGDIMNALTGGETAISDEANLGAARTLRAMENPMHIPTWEELFGAGGGGGVMVGTTPSGEFDPLNPPTTEPGEEAGTGGQAGIGSRGVQVGGAGGALPAQPYKAPVPLPEGFRDWTEVARAVWGPSYTDTLGQLNDPMTRLALYGMVTGQQNATMPTVAPGTALQGHAPGDEMANFDVAPQIGMPMTAGQRSTLGTMAGNAYQQTGTPFVSDQEIANVLGVAYKGAQPQFAGGMTIDPNTGKAVPVQPQAAPQASPAPQAQPPVVVPNVTANAGAPATVPPTAPASSPVLAKVDASGTIAPKAGYDITWNNGQYYYTPKLARGGVVVGGAPVLTGDSSNNRPNEELVINLNPDPNDRFMVVPMQDVRQHGLHQAMRRIAARGVRVGGAAEDGGVFSGDSYLSPITPEDEPYLERVRAIRAGTDYPNLNPFAADYTFMDPTIRASYEQGLQAAVGVPVASLQAYQQRYQLPGIMRGALRIGV